MQAVAHRQAHLLLRGRVVRAGSLGRQLGQALRVGKQSSLRENGFDREDLEGLAARQRERLMRLQSRQWARKVVVRLKLARRSRRGRRRLGLCGGRLGWLGGVGLGLGRDEGGGDARVATHQHAAFPAQRQVLRHALCQDVSRHGQGFLFVGHGVAAEEALHQGVTHPPSPQLVRQPRQPGLQRNRRPRLALLLVWCIEVLKLGEGSGVQHRAYKRLHHFRVWPKGRCKCLQALQNELPALAYLHRLLV
mmetsp:Transcript_4351/g.8212  ORF Transcript_4351/g.8212 Transcript_4351/m.8212 type:complete len:249 (-) Transcript_4351:548-1294(-)